MRELALSNPGLERWGVSVSGVAGSGKSALFAKIRRELETEEENGDCHILSHASGVSLRSDNVDAMIRRWT